MVAGDRSDQSQYQQSVLYCPSMIMMAFAMISEGLDNCTIAGVDPASAGRRDPFKFEFE